MPLAPNSERFRALRWRFVVSALLCVPRLRALSLACCASVIVATMAAVPADGSVPPVARAAVPASTLADQSPAGEPQGEPSEEDEALAEARESGESVAVAEAATPTQTLVANPDGTLTLGVTADPVRVEDARGDLVDIDTSLRSVSGALETVATTAEVVLDDDGVVAADESLAVTTDEGTGVSIGLGYDQKLSEPVVDGAEAFYAQDETTAVRVTALDAGFAVHVLLDESPSDLGANDGGPVYRFPLRIAGARARLVGGSLEFVDADGAVVASSSVLRMWDASVDSFGDPANVEFVDAALADGPGDSQVLELRPDPAFLNDPATVYPVTVDPDVTLNPSLDTYVSSQSKDASFASDWSLRVGSNDGVNKNRAWLSFPMGAQAGSVITDASLRLFQYGAGTCSPRRVYARLAAGDFAEGSPKRTWRNMPNLEAEDSKDATSGVFNASASGGGTAACPDGAQWQNIDVTGQTSSWAGGLENASWGLYLTAPTANELAPTFEKRFCSADRNTTSSGYCRDDRKPELQITYVPQLGDQSWYSTTKRNLDERTVLKINHRSGNAYLAAQDVQVTSLGLDVALGRRYNSRAETVGQFGPKWSLNAGPDVWLEKLDEWRYVYHTPDGAELGPFVREASQSQYSTYRKFRTPAGGLGARLKDNSDDTFTLTFNQSQDQFDFTRIGTSGHLYQTKQRDRSGNATTFTYTAGTTRLASVSDSSGRSYQVTYGTGATAGFITQLRDTNGPSVRTWTYTYTNGRLSAYKDPENDTTTYTWVTPEQTPYQVVGTITNPNNASGQAPTTTLTTNASTTISTNYAGASSGVSANYEYAYANNPKAPCDPSTDDKSGAVKSIQTGQFITYCFKDRDNGDLNNDNANNAKTTVFDQNNRKRSTSYSADNQPEEYSDSTGTTVNTYGDAGSETQDRIESSTQAKDSESSGSGAKTTYTYNTNTSKPGGDYLPSSAQDGNGDCTAYEYDATGRLSKTWTARTPNSLGVCEGSQNGELLYQVEYNNDGTVAWMSDPNASGKGTSPTSAQKTIFSYWKPVDTGFVPGTTGTLKEKRRPGGTCATGTTRTLCDTYTYDGLSRTASAIDGRGITTRSSYDTMDRTTQSLSNSATTCQITQGTCITYAYDTSGNLTQRLDQTGTTTFGFDRQNRQTSQSTPDGVVVSYGYNRDSRMTTLTQALPGQAPDTATYTYANDQLSSITDSSGTMSVVYDSNNRLQRTSFPTSPDTFVDRTYTNAGMAKALTVSSGVTTNDQLTDYIYKYTNEANRDTNQLQRLEVKNSPSSITYNADFDYNNRGQLLSETRSNGGGNGSSFTYDDAGNLATATKGSSTTHYGYDQANQLCWTGPSDGTSPVATCPSTAPGASQVVARDKAGNSAGSASAPISYNPRNQATDISGVSQGYRDQGNDLRFTAGPTHLVNTTTGITARTTNTAGTGAPTGPTATTAFYTRMPDGRILNARTPGAPAATIFYVTDNNKTVLGLIDTSGDRAGTYRYDPYGNATLVEGTTAEQANPFRWISGYQNNSDQPGGYYKLGARYYNPNNAAFTQTDPEPGNMQEPLRTNAYAYSLGDPINNTDFSGRSSCARGVGVGIASAVGLYISGAFLFGGVTTPIAVVGFLASVYAATDSYATIAQECF